MRVLILCTGNSCRSQMAHGFLQSFDKNIEVYSGGTDPAAQVNAKAVEVMKEVGIDISSHVPTHVNTYLDQEWDYVITVCGRLCSTRIHFYIFIERLQKAVCHLAAATISCTKNQYSHINVTMIN
jgi:protein-tyrosine-phosphatase